MKLIELRKKSIHNLYNDLLNLLQEKFNLRIQLSQRKLKHVHLLRRVRRNISRIKTILTEKRKY
ncbi:50S ribosomal protein L29 [Buchnera aphidicola]|uniref:Large ribosomal subunit protein uL29 n=1 Tax=Buchnera aphidicola (Stegophylla sp.) TaxID=2315800 RepID=A0A4D6YLF7_9GAMM|nr:50S ribosomal protein L29 [Buchnera aphidicola (Stegophylla sp.)]QCI26478.1 50S ribosomal protein L29 [Buchnera aphidicola (Stegophylla sp.)]